MKSSGFDIAFIGCYKVGDDLDRNVKSITMKNMVTALNWYLNTDWNTSQMFCYLDPTI